MGGNNSKPINDKGSDPPPYDWPDYASSFNIESSSTPASITSAEAVFSIRAKLLVKNPGDAGKWSEPRICIIKFIKNINDETCSLIALDIHNSKVLLNHFIAPEYNISTIKFGFFKLSEYSNFDYNQGSYQTYTLTRNRDLKELNNLLALKICFHFGSEWNSDTFKKEFIQQQNINKNIESNKSFLKY